MKKLIVLLVAISLVLASMSFTALAAELADGTYTAAANGNNGPVTVEVTIAKAAIESVKVVEHTETPGISDPAFETVPGAIVEHQSIGIDTVAGATMTSNAILTAVADCIKQAGGDPEAWKKEVVKEAKDLGDRTAKAEILVIGGGGTGLAAAMSAIDNGAKNVIVVEKMPRFGGSTSNSGAVVAAQNTRYYNEAGLTTDFDAWLADWKASSDSDIGVLGKDPGYPTYERVRKYFDQVAETVNWMEKLGTVHWVEYPFFPGGYYQVPEYIVSEAGADPEGGYMLVDHMVQWLKENGADMRLNTKGTKLITNEKGDVIGATVEDENGSYDIYAERGVVLATGGFAASTEMMKEYLPQFADWIDLTTSGLGNTGDGIRMAEEVGGVMYNDPYVITLGSTARNATLMPFCMSVNLWGRAVVNSDGNRFFNEYAMPYQATVALSQTKDGISWAVGDAANPLASVLEAAVDGVEVVKADTVAELAEKMGVNAENLVATIDAYNKASTDGGDAFGKPVEYMTAINTAPYYAVRIYVCTGGTISGVKTDLQFHVLREDGTVINGLWAGGETSNREMYAYAYSSGSGVGYALASGHEIGRNIMSESK